MTAAPERIVPCPICRKPVHYAPTSRYRPFCSERCRLMDLGAWASGDYQISDDSAPQDDSAAADRDD